MDLTLKDLTKDINNVNEEDILSCWRWLISNPKNICLISCLGDLFLTGQDGAIYWLATDSGELTKIADNSGYFELLLNDKDLFDYWFFPQLVQQLLEAGKILKENEVYSFVKLPVIGGEYSIDNIQPTDISVHFAFSGQICEQIKDLPDGTKVNIRLAPG